MDYTGIISNADTLKRSSLIKVIVTDNVRELLYKINTCIIDGFQQGKSKIQFQLPINFSIDDPNIKNKDVQTSIYYKIVSELERKNYKVRLVFYKNHTILVVDWLQYIDQDELTKMREKIAQVSSIKE
jgi:hypothetical protein